MAKKCGAIGAFFGLCRKKHRKLGDAYDTVKNFKKGYIVSISNVRFFNRHGIVTKVGNSLVHVKVNLLNKVYKFSPEQLRVVY